jgi:uncharacterized membrane protein YgdD (TMEM256/DUF423 family)
MQKPWDFSPALKCNVNTQKQKGESKNVSNLTLQTLAVLNLVHILALVAVGIRGAVDDRFLCVSGILNVGIVL